jgi:hypothetical protein
MVLSMMNINREMRRASSSEGETDEADRMREQGGQHNRDGGGDAEG